MATDTILRPGEIKDILLREIEAADLHELDVEEVGTVLEVKDGIARIYGLQKAMAGEMLEVTSSETGNKVTALALNLEEDNIGAVILGDYLQLKEGDEVRRTSRVLDVPVGPTLVGRVVDALGRPIDGQGEINATLTRKVESPAPGIIVRQPVKEPLQTGLKAIDSMIPIGREAYPGDVFYLHSRLLERAAKLREDAGVVDGTNIIKPGGSLTALPIIETQAGDVSAYIPTNVISITDGQIFLEADLFFSGVRPAINVGISVSRVGGSAQVKAMKAVAGRLRLDLAQYRELEAFASFASDLDAATKKQLERGARTVEILKQGQYQPMPVEQQVMILYAVANGYVDDVQVAQIKDWERSFLDFVAKQFPQVPQKIRSEKILSKETEADLKRGIEAFNQQFNSAKR